MTTEKNSKESLGYEEYRNHEAYSQSDLKYIHSPKLFHKKKIEPYEEGDQKPWQRMGDLFDKYILSPQTFYEEHIIRPEMETPGHQNQHKFVAEVINHLSLQETLTPEDCGRIHRNCYANKSMDKHIKEGVSLYATLKTYINFQIRSEGKEVITEKEADTVTRMATAFEKHELLNFFFIDTPENFGTWNHLRIIGMPMYGVQWKGEIDRLVIDFQNKVIYVIDVKTTSSYVAYFPTSYKKYKYYKQQALYEKLVLWWLQQRNIVEDPYDGEWQIVSRIAVVETTSLNEARFIPIPFDIINEGLKEIKEDAQKILYYEKNGWERTISYRTNGGLEAVDWSETFDLPDDEELEGEDN